MGKLERTDLRKGGDSGNWTPPGGTMKTIIAAALLAAFSAGPVLACDAMKDEASTQSSGKAAIQADVKTVTKAEAKARTLKTAKSSKAAKPLSEGKKQDRQI
jgi:hypothetical protein